MGLARNCHCWGACNSFEKFRVAGRKLVRMVSHVSDMFASLVVCVALSPKKVNLSLPFFLVANQSSNLRAVDHGLG